MSAFFLVCLVASSAGCRTTWGGSIGAVMTRENPTGRVYVRDAPEGMPAAKAGLAPGDEIVAIDGRLVHDLSADAVHLALEGAVGSKVRLTVTRKSDGATQDIKVERGPLAGAAGGY